VLVEEVAPGSAASAGIQAGDILLKLGRQPLHNAAQLADLAAAWARPWSSRSWSNARTTPSSAPHASAAETPAGNKNRILRFGSRPARQRRPQQPRRGNAYKKKARSGDRAKSTFGGGWRRTTLTTLREVSVSASVISIF